MLIRDPGQEVAVPCHRCRRPIAATLDRCTRCGAHGPRAEPSAALDAGATDGHGNIDAVFQLLVAAVAILVGLALALAALAHFGAVTG